MTWKYNSFSRFILQRFFSAYSARIRQWCRAVAGRHSPGRWTRCSSCRLTSRRKQSPNLPSQTSVRRKCLLSIPLYLASGQWHIPRWKRMPRRWLSQKGRYRWWSMWSSQKAWRWQRVLLPEWRTRWHTFCQTCHPAFLLPPYLWQRRRGIRRGTAARSVPIRRTYPSERRWSNS